MRVAKAWSLCLKLGRNECCSKKGVKKEISEYARDLLMSSQFWHEPRIVNSKVTAMTFGSKTREWRNFEARPRKN